MSRATHEGEDDMTPIHVPRPSLGAMDADRPISSLLKTQVEHLQVAEKRLPSRYRSEIYTNAIKTEADAARYIRHVTEAIHKAHEEATARRPSRESHVKSGLEIAAVAERPVQTRKSSTKPKRKGADASRKRQG